VCLAIIAAASAESRRGVNTGIVQNFFGSLIGTAIAPIVLVWLATNFGWRTAFYISGIPGLILALLIWRFIREPEAPPRPAVRERQQLIPWSMFRQRNVVVCSVVSCLMVGSLVIGSIFLPLYFTGPAGWEPGTMGWVMAVLGLTPGIGGVAVAWLSDKIGRRPPLIFGCFLAVVCPLAALYFDGPIPLLTAIMFVGWLGIGVFPLFMGVIPGESMPRKYAATAMGLVVCVGEIAGGTLLVLLAGAVADATNSLSSAILMMAACGAIGCVLCFFLVETAPVKARAGAAGAVAAKAV
jgi:MFS family permease